LQDAISSRAALATRIAIDAGKLGLTFFNRLGTLTITTKGHQDMVSEADRDLETFLRREIVKAFPDDAILGEEHGLSRGSSGFTWVLDPIDGTANFVNAIPAWCVVVACTSMDETVVGVIHDPNANETFAAILGHGATLNGLPISVAKVTSLADGSVGIGVSNRVAWQPTVRLIAALMAHGGLYFRNASGALMLAYVASGRLIGYCEQHMNAWDCVAGLLMVREAGGCTNTVATQEMLRLGGLVVAAAPGIINSLETLTTEAFTPAAARDLPWQS
jgi:myo-inositol-1(or 4)-monophosphatase